MSVLGEFNRGTTGNIEISAFVEQMSGGEVEDVFIVLNDSNRDLHTLEYAVTEEGMADQAYGSVDEDQTKVVFVSHEFPTNTIHSDEEEEMLEIRKKAALFLGQKGYHIPGKDSGLNFGASEN